MRCFCGNEMIDIIINKNKFHRCKNCGYLKKDDILTPQLEKERYDLHVCDSGYLKYMNNVYKKIEPYLNNGLSIDYGCGKIHALADIMNSNNRMCKYYDLYYYDNEINDKFDNIILIEVFEHINDPVGIIKYLKNLLNDNGKIIIMTQLVKEPLDKWWYLRDSTHVSFQTEKSMEILSGLLGFDFNFDSKNEIFILTKKN